MATAQGALLTDGTATVYKLWQQDPNAVHASWRVYFSGMDKNVPADKAYNPPPTLVSMPAGGAPTLSSPGQGRDLEDHMKVRSPSRPAIGPDR